MDKDIQKLIEESISEMHDNDFSKEAVMKRVAQSNGDRFDIILSESTSFSSTLLGIVLSKLKENGSLKI